MEAQENILKFNHLTVNDGLPQNSIHAIAKDKYGFMWFGTWGGVCRYDGYTFKVFRANENDPTAFADNMIDAIVSDSQQNIWIKTGESDCLYKFSYEYETFQRFAKKNVATYIVNLTEQQPVSENKKFKFTYDESGLKQTDKISGKQTIYKLNPNNPFAISDESIYTTYLDDAQNLWIGTRKGGINHANLNVKPFTYYAGNTTKKLISNEVRAICKDKMGRLWIGSEDMGVTVLDNNKTKNLYFNTKTDINNRRIRSLYCDRLGYVWIGTKGGLHRYDPKSNSIKSYFKDKTKAGHLTDPNVFDMLEDSEGTLWIGTFSGLAKYDRKNDRFLYVPKNLISGVQIRSIIEDHQKNLWIATEDRGLTKLTQRSDNNDAAKFKSVRYIHTQGNDKMLISNRLYSLVEDGSGKIWIASNQGLIRLDPKNNSFKNFFIKDGLPDDIIMGVLYDGKKSIWVSHKKGLSQINTTTLEIQNFNVNDGLQSNEFNQNACFRDYKTGEMFFGGPNGLNSFFPDKIQINKYKPKTVLSQLRIMNQVVKPGLRINDQIILNKSLLCTNEILLSWWNKNFSLDFAALHYANPLGNKYKYKLEGYDHHWIFTSGYMHTASYTNLPSGNYTFKVYGSNNDGIWSDKPAVLYIEILPPWWLSWWSIMLYLIVALGIILIIYKYIAARIEFNKNEEIQQSKLHFFTGISHEFRTPLTLIIDPLEKLISEKLDKETINHYHALMHRNAKQLLLLINQLLDFRKLESGHLTLNLEQTDIIAFVKTVVASFESRAQDKNIQFLLQSNIESQKILFDAAKMNMVLNNLLSNAFKFTPQGGEVVIDVSFLLLDKQMLVVKIQDTGTGIAEQEIDKVFDIFYQSPASTTQQEGSGVGLALTKELIQLHGGEITLESRIGQGSIFSVFLPVLGIEQPQKQVHYHEIIQNHNESVPTETLKHIEVDTEAPLLLIVDDNMDIRNYIALNFNTEYRIILSNNGTEGFLQAIEMIPDLIISDVMMPEMNGLELSNKLKSDERTSHIPIILLTARQSDESKTEGYQTGADAYVTKPFNTNVLRAQIQNLLKQRQRLRELFSHGSTMEINKIAINVTDEAFLKKVIEHIHKNIENEEFNIDNLAEILKMSRSQFYRKIKALTNQSLLDFVTTIRMNKALEFLLSGNYNISETAHKVGYSMSSNFTRTFTRHFGVSPSKYIESFRK